MPPREVHVEHLLGRRVVDADGRALGRLEELRADVVDGVLSVTEFHVGSGALLERIAGFLRQLPLLSRIPGMHTEYRVSWTDVDLGDPARPRVRETRERLRRVPVERHP